MKVLRKIIGWFMVLMCVAGLFSSILAIVTIFTSVGEELYWAENQLPTYLFLTVAFGWIAYYLLGKKKEEIPTEKVKTGHKLLIYFCEALVVIIGACLIGTIAYVITQSYVVMHCTMYVGILVFAYVLPSPQKVLNYWKRRKEEKNE